MIIAVYAMARPRRPTLEGDLVVAAASGSGSVAKQAQALAMAVTSAAMSDIDLDPGDRLVALLSAAPPDAIQRLATEPEIGTANLIVRERLNRLEARGGRHLREWEWRAEDRQVLSAVSATLAERYARFIRSKKCA